MTVKSALIFAAGFGKRLAPITDSLPKPLVVVAGKSLIQYHIEKLVQLGITEIVINTHWLHHKLVDALGDGGALGACIHWSHEPEILETGAGMQNALPFLGKDPFIVVSADIWTDYSFAPLLDNQLLNQRPHSLAHLVMVENPEHNPAGDFVLESADTRFARVSSASATVSSKNNSRYTYSGIGLFCPEFILHYIQGKQHLNSIEKERAGKVKIEPYPLRDPLNSAVAKGLVSAEVYSGRWHDIGTIDRLHRLKEEFA